MPRTGRRFYPQVRKEMAQTVFARGQTIGYKSAFGRHMVEALLALDLDGFPSLTTVDKLGVQDT